MFGKDSTNKDFDTLIGKSSTFEGNITTEGSLRLDGKIIGNTKISGTLYVGKDAVIKGNVEATDVHLSGSIEGNVTLSGVLKMDSSSKLYGDIQVKGFVADEGGIFQGNCKMVEPQ
jgi:cytoskeletal protein CcmA (bactofilin family)